MQTDINLKGKSLPSQASLLRTEKIKIKFSDGKNFLNTVQTKLQNFCKLLTEYIPRLFLNIPNTQLLSEKACFQRYTLLQIWIIHSPLASKIRG